MKTNILAATTLTLATLFAGTAKADHFEHIDAMANQMRNQASRTAWEVRHNFRGTPQYRHLYSDVYEMYTTANHVHEMIHEGANINHLRADVESLDRLFHHVEELVREIRPANDFGFHGHHGHFHVSSGPSRDDLRRLRGMLNEMEETLHHLQNDLGALSGSGPPAASLVRPVPYEVRVGSRQLGVTVRIP